MVHILGSGCAGLGAKYALTKKDIPSMIFEQDSGYGGLCRRLTIKDFIFDRFVHFSFTKDKQIQELFAPSSNFYFSHKPEAYNYYHKNFFLHPIQNNLYPLSEQEKKEIIHSYEQRPVYEKLDNFQQFLDASYGTVFTEKFPAAYTRKYWTVEPKDLETSWVGNRILVSDLEEIKKGAYTNTPSSKYYTNEFRYPKRGGYQAFLDNWAVTDDIFYEHTLVKWDSERKILYFSNGKEYFYEHLISTIPLPKLISLAENVPQHISDAAKQLDCTSGITISIGLKGELLKKYLWFYIYDEDILPSRVYSPSLKSPYNAPDGYSSLQAEIYYSKYKPLPMNIDNLIEHTIDKLCHMGVITQSQIHFAEVHNFPYANVMFTHPIEANKNKLHEWLRSKHVFCAGRFGEWAYLWSDQAVLSGIRVANNIAEKF